MANWSTSRSPNQKKNPNQKETQTKKRPKPEGNLNQKKPKPKLNPKNTTKNAAKKQKNGSCQKPPFSLPELLSESQMIEKTLYESAFQQTSKTPNWTKRLPVTFWENFVMYLKFELSARSSWTQKSLETLFCSVFAIRTHLQIFPKPVCFKVNFSALSQNRSFSKKI